jgi:hypothetical protein
LDIGGVCTFEPLRFNLFPSDLPPCGRLRRRTFKSFCTSKNRQWEDQQRTSCQPSPLLNLFTLVFNLCTPHPRIRIFQILVVLLVKMVQMLTKCTKAACVIFTCHRYEKYAYVCLVLTTAFEQVMHVSSSTHIHTCAAICAAIYVHTQEHALSLHTQEHALNLCHTGTTNKGQVTRALQCLAVNVCLTCSYVFLTGFAVSIGTRNSISFRESVCLIGGV